MSNISFDPAKRERTLRERRLDFRDATEVLASPLRYTVADDRFDYGEVRHLTTAPLRGRVVVVVWTQRQAGPHIISMRKANDREQKRFRAHVAALF